jgi:hypothetical protein
MLEGMRAQFLHLRKPNVFSLENYIYVDLFSIATLLSILSVQPLLFHNVFLYYYLKGTCLFCVSQMELNLRTFQYVHISISRNLPF